MSGRPCPCDERGRGPCRGSGTVRSSSMQGSRGVAFPDLQFLHRRRWRRGGGRTGPEAARTSGSRKFVQICKRDLGRRLGELRPAVTGMHAPVRIGRTVDAPGSALSRPGPARTLRWRAGGTVPVLQPRCDAGPFPSASASAPARALSGTRAGLRQGDRGAGGVPGSPAPACGRSVSGFPQRCCGRAPAVAALARAAPRSHRALRAPVCARGSGRR
jgi:hypothetical protein